MPAERASTAPRRRVLTGGAPGRDFHDFNVVFRDAPAYEVVGFTAAQIPNIAGRTYPPQLAGPLYPAGIPILPQKGWEGLVRTRGGGPPPPRRRGDDAPRPAARRLHLRRAHRLRQEPPGALRRRRLPCGRAARRRRAPPHALRRPGRAGGAALCP